LSVHPIEIGKVFAKHYNIHFTKEEEQGIFWKRITNSELKDGSAIFDAYPEKRCSREFSFCGTKKYND